MKSKINSLLGLLVAIGLSAHAQLGTTISVSNDRILGPCGDTLLLRGVNYAVYNWGWSPGVFEFDQIAMTGANCVRIPWYQNPASGTPTTTYSDLTNLDSALSKAIQNKLIPILDLHDLTCQNDTAALLSLANWYVQPGVLALIDKYKHSILLNVSNEVLYVAWTANPSAAQATFVNAHSAISQTLRNAGITVPIVVDGADCGQNLDVLASVGSTLQQNDPAHNTIFSAHAYWYGFANNDSAQMEAKLDNAIAAGIPFFLGEIANLQDDQTMCQYTLDYQALLRICQRKDIGWLAWGWDRDGCPDRQVSSTGLFADLTPYGDDIVHNGDYGLLTVRSPRSQYLLSNGCPAVGIADQAPTFHLRLYPNPSDRMTTLDFGRSADGARVEVTNYAGQVVQRLSVENAASVELKADFAPGIYLVRVLVDGSPVGQVRMVKL